MRCQDALCALLAMLVSHAALLWLWSEVDPATAEIEQVKKPTEHDALLVVWKFSARLALVSALWFDEGILVGGLKHVLWWVTNMFEWLVS